MSRKTPFKNTLKDKALRYVHKSIYKPGHYHSAVPDPIEIDRRSKEIFDPMDPVLGINLNDSGQMAFCQEASVELAHFPYLNSVLNNGLRYHKKNNFFGVGDTLSLFLVMKRFMPKRIIEVGSGFSSAAMLDINDIFFDGRIDIQLIEPYTVRLFSLLKTNDKERINILSKFVQDAPIDIYKQLEENDMLFIDSSHVSKIGSDVNFIFFNILPRLKKGVLIHFHDIFYPFEYIKKWVDYGIYWNEAYLLRSFLLYNDSFEIIIFNDYLNKLRKNEICLINPLYENLDGASIWLRKKA